MQNGKNYIPVQIDSFQAIKIGHFEAFKVSREGREENEGCAVTVNSNNKRETLQVLCDRVKDTSGKKLPFLTLSSHIN